jgi:hypothetical protein
VEQEITRKSILLDCLTREDATRRSFSREARGMTAIRGFEKEFDEYEKRCRILRDLIQALESTEVTEAMMKWQIRAMKGERTTEELKAENMPAEPTPDRPVVIPTGCGQPEAPVDYRWDGQHMETQLAMRF